MTTDMDFRGRPWSAADGDQTPAPFGILGSSPLLSLGTMSCAFCQQLVFPSPSGKRSAAKDSFPALWATRKLPGHLLASCLLWGPRHATSGIIQLCFAAGINTKIGLEPCAPDLCRLHCPPTLALFCFLFRVRSCLS